MLTWVWKSMRTICLLPHLRKEDLPWCGLEFAQTMASKEEKWLMKWRYIHRILHYSVFYQTDSICNQTLTKLGFSVLSLEQKFFLSNYNKGMYVIINNTWYLQLTENCDASHLPPEEVHPNVLRVGWSANSTSMQLGKPVKVSHLKSADLRSIYVCDVRL